MLEIMIIMTIIPLQKILHERCDSEIMRLKLEGETNQLSRLLLAFFVCSQLEDIRRELLEDRLASPWSRGNDSACGKDPRGRRSRPRRLSDWCSRRRCSEGRRRMTKVEISLSAHYNWSIAKSSGPTNRDGKAGQLSRYTRHSIPSCPDQEF